jgi:hypothetical protein
MRAGNQGICTVEQNHCSRGGDSGDGNSIECGTSSGGFECWCYVTTTGNSFCGDTSVIQTCDCTSNRQCERRHGKSSKCVAIGADPSPPCLATDCSTGTGCIPPCKDLFPV